MRFSLCIICSMVVLIAGLGTVCAGSHRVTFYAPSTYGQNYSTGFDRGYAAAWNACRTGDELHRWVRDWSDWVITNPAYVRGYREGVRQAIRDAEFLDKESLYFLEFYE